MRTFLIVLFCCISSALLAQQQNASRSELEKRRQSILEAIKITQEQLEITKKDKKATLGQLQALQNKLAERQKLISNINDEIGEINRNIQYSSREISQLRLNLDMLKVRYAQSVRYAYKNRSSYSMLAFLFSSSDFNQAIRRLKYLKKYRDYRKQQADQIRVTQKRIGQKIEVLNSERSQKDVLLTAQVQQKMELQKETLDKDKVVKDLKGREQELAGDIAKNQKSLRGLEKTIANLIQREIELAKKREEEERRKAEADRKRREEEQQRSVDAYARNSGISLPARTGNASTTPKNNTSAATSPGGKPSSGYHPVALEPGAAPVRNSNPSYKLSLTPEVAALSNNFESNRGRLLWPVEQGFIAESFGRKKHPVYNIEMDNSGIEIKTAPNATARAVFNGKITAVIYVPGMGQCVVITHGQYFTVYSRLGNVSVKKGDNVTTKQPIGTVIENENGEYLMHFELWKVGSNDKATAQNPAGWIAQ